MGHPRIQRQVPWIAVTALSVSAGLVTTAAPAAASGPPPGRAYELVSPADDLGGAPAGVSIDSRPMPGLAPAVGDDRFVYGAVSPIGATESGATNPFIFGRRTSTGWSAITALRTTDGGETALGFNTSDSTKAWINDEGTGLVFMVANSLGLPQPDTGGQAFQSVYRIGEFGPPEWLSGSAPGATLNTVSLLQEVVASRDLQTVAFQSPQPLTPGGPPAGQWGVYVKKNGQLHLASVLPNGDLPTSDASFANPVTGATLQSNPPALALRNLLTRDGRYLVFALKNPDGTAAELYVRDLEEGTTRTLAPPSGPAIPFSSDAGFDDVFPWIPGGNASPSKLTMPLGFVTVASNAPIAFFRSAGNLAPGATGADYDKIYQADLATGHLTYRAEIDGAPVELSADGRKVLFLRPTGDTFGDPWELRFWDADAPDESVLLGSIDGALNDTFNLNGLVRSLRSSTDGRTWVFTGADSLDPTRPNGVAGAVQVYRWRIGDAHPTCLSCDPVDGQVRFGGVSLSQAEVERTETVRRPGGDNESVRKFAMAQRSRAISDDGRLVAFDSPDRLVPDDTNDVRDVYLWDADAPADEQLQMLTSGQGTAPSYYIDVSPDGRNVFFSTQDGLVPSDKDVTYDVYVARRGGGFPDSPESCVPETEAAAATTAEPCRPPVIAPPGNPFVGSGTFAPPSSGGQKPVQTGSPKLRVRSVRSARSLLTVRVDAPQAGRIRVSGSRVKTTSRTAKRQATYRVRVPLKASAQRSILRGKTVKVKLRIAFTPQGAKKASTVSASVSVGKGR